jgi:hypothetical protein
MSIIKQKRVDAYWCKRTGREEKKDPIKNRK